MDASTIRQLCDRVHDALAMAESPPATGGVRGGAFGSRPPMPTSIIDAKEDLKAKLVSWALMIGEEAEVVIDCDDDSQSIAAWIYIKADWLAHHPAAEDFRDEIEEKLLALTRPYATQVDQRIYLGVHQGEALYARPGQATIELPNGQVERTKTLRDEMIMRLWDLEGSPSLVADVARIHFGVNVDAKKITTTASDDARRGRAQPLTPVATVPLTYRVGDVVERMLGSRKWATNAVS